MVGGRGGEEGSCLAVIELVPEVSHTEGGGEQGDPYEHEGHEALGPKGEGVILLHHWATQTGDYRAQTAEGVPTPTHVGGGLNYY